MGLADFFGGGALRAEIKTLKEELETAQDALRAVKEDAGGLKKQLASKEKTSQEARTAQKKAQQKLEKVSGARSSTEKKTKALEEKVSHLQSELDAFQKAMLEARAESEKLRAKLHGPKGRRPAPQAAPKTEPQAESDAEAKPEVVRAPVERAPRRQDAFLDDRKVERLEELLHQTREQRDGFKERVAKAEKTARDAQYKQRSDSGKAEAAVRDLQHNLRSERKAYRILQMQFEAQVDRAKGAQQEVDARVKQTLEALKNAPKTEAQTSAEPRKQIAKVLEDAPAVAATPVVKPAEPVAKPAEPAAPVVKPAEPAAPAVEASAPMPGLPPVANTSPLAKDD